MATSTQTSTIDPEVSVPDQSSLRPATLLRFAAIWIVLSELSWRVLCVLPVVNNRWLYIAGLLMLFVAIGILSQFNKSVENDGALRHGASRRSMLKSLANLAAVGVLARAAYFAVPLNPLRKAPEELFLPMKQQAKTCSSQEVTEFELLPDAETPIDVLVLINSASHFTTPSHTEMVRNLRPETKILIVVDHQDAAHESWKMLRDAQVPRLDDRLRFIYTPEFRKQAKHLLRQWAQDSINILYNPRTSELTIAEVPSLLRTPPFTTAYNIMGHQIAERDIPWVSFAKNSFDELPLLGGEITSDRRYVYVTEGSYDIENLERLTNRKVVVLPTANTTHTDLFHAAVGQSKFGKHTSVLPDPIAFCEIIRSLTDSEKRAAIDEIKSLAPTPPLTLHKNRRLIDYKDVWNSMLNISDEQFEEIRNSKYVQQLKDAEQILTDKGNVIKRVPGISVKGMPFGVYPTNIVQDLFLDDAGNRVRSAYIPKYGITKVDDAIADFYRDLGSFQYVYAIPAVHEGHSIGGIRCRCKKIGVPLSPLD